MKNKKRGKNHKIKGNWASESFFSVSLGFVLIPILFSVLCFFFSKSFPTAQAAPSIELKAYIFGKDNQELPDQTYEIRFAFYAQDRANLDPYPSNSDGSVWQEVQQIEIKNSILKANLGSINPFPELDPDQDYYLGIRIGTDSELVPRKKISASPFSVTAKNSRALEGHKTGQNAGDIPLIANGGTLDEIVIPDLTRVGTITTGTWEGDMIDSGYLDSTLSVDSLELASALSISNGGTGIKTAGKAGSIVYSTGTTYGFSSQGTAGQILLSGGTGAPVWGTMSGGSINSNSIDLSELKDTLTLDANLIFNPSNNNYSINFDSGTLFINSTNNRIGIGTITPETILDVNGVITATGGTSTDWNTAYANRITSASTPLSIVSNAISISQATASTDGYLSSANWSLFDSKQTAYANLSSVGSLANSAGWLHNDGSGSFSYSTPTGLISGLDSGFVPYAAGSASLSDSNIFYDGTNVGIGTTHPAAFKLEVTGDIGPEADGTRNLGSPDRYFNTAYIQNLVTGTSGTVGYWSRTGTILSPVTDGDLLAIYGGSSNSSGTILEVSYENSVTLSGELIGAKLDLNDGYVTPTNQNVTGLRVVLPTTTNTNPSGTISMNGMFLGYGVGTGINQNGAGGTIYSGVNLELPALTQTSGNLIANGAFITTPSSITTGGTANGINISATGIGAGSLNGVNISSITAGSGSETALKIGSGWDNVLEVNGTQIVNSLGIVQVAGGGTGLSTYTTGDIIYASATDTLSKLAGGAANNGKVLVISSGLPTWGVLSGSSCTDCVINDPTSVSTQTITPNNQNISSLVVRQTTYATPSENIFEITSSNGSNVYFYVDKNGNVSTGGVSSQSITLTPTSDTSALTLVGTNVPTESLQYIKAGNTQGIISKLDYGTAKTLSAALTGQKIDLSTNLTATDQSVTGIQIILPTVTNTTSTSDYKGLSVALSEGSGVNQNGAGTTIWSGADITIPALTQTAGTLIANGAFITTPSSITTGGTANGINISATGIGAGSLNGVNISSITTGSGSETALKIGSGWDFGIYSTTTGTSYFAGNVGIGMTNPTAFLHIASPTTSKAQLRFESGSDPTLPEIGDFWFNGTNLYFRKDGSTSQDLLSGGISGFGETGFLSRWEDSSTLGNSLIYDDGASLGVGTTNPSYVLDINGDIRTQGGNVVFGSTDISEADIDALNDGTIALGTETTGQYWNSSNDGTGSGLDADKLDGFDSSAFGDATAANQTTILGRIGTNADAASMSSTLFAGQQYIADNMIPKYYQTSGTYNGSTADTACAAEYHMCMISEWTSRTYNTSLGGDGTLENASWIDTNTNSATTGIGDCTNWTNNTTHYGTTVTVASGTSTDLWQFGSAYCSNAMRVLCCSN